MNISSSHEILTHTGWCPVWKLNPNMHQIVSLDSNEKISNISFTKLIDDNNYSKTICFFICEHVNIDTCADSLIYCKIDTDTEYTFNKAISLLGKQFTIKKTHSQSNNLEEKKGMYVFYSEKEANETSIQLIMMGFSADIHKVHQNNTIHSWNVVYSNKENGTIVSESLQYTRSFGNFGSVCTIVHNANENQLCCVRRHGVMAWMPL